MRRNVTLEEISDGRLYGPNDMVKADAQGCAGCSKCCQGMGNSIILDPYDVFRLTTGLKCSMEELLQKYAQLNVVDGVILPNLRMTGKEERCPFLNAQERCSIHPLRPGVCRLFPLGRYYENGSFRYFLQTGECTALRTKVKVSKWIDTPDGKRNQEFIITWHYLLKEVEELLWENGEDSFCRNLNLFLLNTFYFAPYALEDFYSQFEERLARFRQVVPKREF
ncbi:MAG TPA: YkgJ family cysteine cluster protein [Candidatus Acetatifactor stercoripullorum]|uniref:YkgJ family cysteine cluster protein n=1 Tax=Candidatus Acetatifactor stercoripullorum TaxID=2838414 RepID=A0A9D1R736_9FIRM|nr:YkgJ family cysteine cluster protein [uncultured Acetatifactor sp.]HIW81221.1 YkgJ family cysteine cluster protein [Candidatus Acetatifactor stercoripullorum]